METHLELHLGGGGHFSDHRHGAAGSLDVALGFNPLRGDLEVFNTIVAPVIKDDIRPITMAHLRNQPVDSAALQADLEQILGNEPLTTSASPFEIDQFATVFVLDAQQNLIGFYAPI